MAKVPTQMFIQHKGHKICVYSFDGKGSPELVMIHGGPGGRSELGFGESLSRHRKTVMYDQFGGGGSDRAAPTDEVSVEYYVGEA